MKLSLIPLILTAGLAVSAAPLRVVVVSERVSGSPSVVRFGHAVAYTVPTPAVLPPGASGGRVVKHKGGCAGSLRLKALKVSDWFRGVFGLPAHKIMIPVGAESAAAKHVPHKNHHWIGASDKSMPAPPTAIFVPDEHQGLPKPRPYHHIHSHHHKRPKAFFHRLTRALMMLGPWEGRLVSFVLGCGIGVLLRIVWVMSVLAIRSLRGKKQEDEFLVDEVIFEEQVHLLPPQYTEAVPQDVKEKAEAQPVAAQAPKANANA